jgi:hypothetical protein
VTPVLAWCLLHKLTALPPEIRDYFEGILTLNIKRSETLLTGLAFRALNAVDIEPVLLKGAARLIDGTYPAPMLVPTGHCGP